MESTWLDEASKMCVIQNSQCEINEVRWVLKSVGFVILDLSEIVSQQSGAEGGILNHSFKQKKKKKSHFCSIISSVPGPKE